MVKKYCEICNNKIGLGRPKIDIGLGDRIVCVKCIKNGEVKIKYSNCEQVFTPEVTMLNCLKPLKPGLSDSKAILQHCMSCFQDFKKNYSIGASAKNQRQENQQSKDIQDENKLIEYAIKMQQAPSIKAHKVLDRNIEMRLLAIKTKNAISQEFGWKTTLCNEEDIFIVSGSNYIVTLRRKATEIEYRVSNIAEVKLRAAAVSDVLLTGGIALLASGAARGVQEKRKKKIVNIINALIAEMSPFDSQSNIHASPLDDLEKLGKLKEQGIITEEEFNQKKKELLDKL